MIFIESPNSQFGPQQLKCQRLSQAAETLYRCGRNRRTTLARGSNGQTTTYKPGTSIDRIYLTTEGSRGLLSAALPSALRAVNVVEASDAGLHVEVLGVVLVQLL